MSPNGISMTHKSELSKRSKRGERFTKNPFIGNALANTKSGVRRICDKSGNRMMVVSQNTGDIIATAGFWQTQTVDKTQFVKLYLNGVTAFKDLSGAGTKVFELLYLKIQENIGKDEIWLTFPSINQDINHISKAVFYRGMKELLNKGFIAESLSPGMYYLNPDYMWNGDRLAFVKQFLLSDSAIANQQVDWVDEINTEHNESGAPEVLLDKEGINKTGN